MQWFDNMRWLEHESWAPKYGLSRKNYIQTTRLCEKEGVPYLRFLPFEELPFITHGFSTRLGGVSKGNYKSMNLSFTRGDEQNAVAENFRRMGRALDTSCAQMVYAMQTHTVNVKEVRQPMGGMGITRARDFSDVDGLVTDVPGLCLVTSYADCVPLFFVDIKKRAIGLSHSGWRGTAGDIGVRTVKKLQLCYDSQPKDVLAFIGPSICKACYEVSSDLYEAFSSHYLPEEMTDLMQPLGGEKYLLNLHLANVLNLKRAGIPSENIFVTDVCTCCNPDLFYSHRASGGKRGGLCGFLKINSEL